MNIERLLNCSRFFIGDFMRDERRISAMNRVIQG